jgi:hypothetical protein
MNLGSAGDVIRLSGCLQAPQRRSNRWLGPFPERIGSGPSRLSWRRLLMGTGAPAAFESQ